MKNISHQNKNRNERFEISIEKNCESKDDVFHSKKTLQKKDEKIEQKNQQF